MKAFDDRVPLVVLDAVFRALQPPYPAGLPFSWPKISKARYHENSLFWGIQACSDHERLGERVI
jgi:hypothetical protein